MVIKKIFARFRVEEAVTDLNPQRPGRAQLRHPVPNGYWLTN